MALRLALLWLGLLFCVHCFKEVIVPSYNPMVFTGAAGPLFSTSLGAYHGVTYPVGTWSISQWIFTTSSTNMSAFFGSVSGISLSVYWFMDELYLQTSIDGSSDLTITEQSFPIGKWVFVVVGLGGMNNGYGIVTVRGEASVGKGSLSDQFKLQTTSKYEGSSDADGFTVIR